MTDKEISALNIENACYYGKQLQMNHFTEEVAELIRAVIERNPEHIAEEIADVEVMVEQMEVLNDLDPEEVAKGISEGQYTMHNQFGDESSCIWSLAGAIKAMNKMRRALRDTALNNHITKADAKIQQDTAKKDFEYRIGDVASCLHWLADKYQSKADRAFDRYQETGIQRYYTERNNAEDLADAMRMAANSADEHEEYIHMRCTLAGFVGLASEISKPGIGTYTREKLETELTESLLSYGRMNGMG